MESLVITNSMKYSYQSCPRKFFYSYIRKLTPVKTPEPLFWGGLVHEVLEIFDIAGLNGVDDWIEEKREEAEAESNALSPADLEQLDSMLTALPNVVAGYALKWKDSVYETIATEKQFSIQLAEGIRFEGKIDGIISLPLQDGTKGKQIMLLERKTAARTGDMYYSSLALNNQLRGYLLGMKELGYDTGCWVLYDVIKKPQIRGRVGETAESIAKRTGEAYLTDHQSLYERTQIKLSEQVVAEYKDELISFARELQRAMESGEYIRAHPLPHQLSWCSFYGLCTGGDTGSQFTTRTKLHPELAE